MAARKIPDVLTPEELKALLEVPNTRYPTGLRNLAMMRVMSDLGLRVSEVVALQVRDVNWRTGQLKVRQGKGAKDRILWLSPDDLELLQSWRDRRPVDSPVLFTTLKGGALNPRYIRALAERCAVKAGIEKRVHPHLLRHTFASDLYRQTLNLRLVQEALGHSAITTTQIYTHLTNGELETALQTFRK